MTPTPVDPAQWLVLIERAQHLGSDIADVLVTQPPTSPYRARLLACQARLTYVVEALQSCHALPEFEI
jgi:hypothetical protein